MSRSVLCLFPLALLAAVLPSCGGESDRQEVLVFAAASLSDSFVEIEQAFEASHEGADIVLSFAGSSSLREQILQGAPADVFASASQDIMSQLDDEAELSSQPMAFTTNRLALAVPIDNPGHVDDLEAFTDPDLLLGVCAAGVPCGDAASELFANAGIEPSIDTNESDVRALLAKIAAGELDAGIVYATDIAAEADSVIEVPIPAELNVTSTYVIARLASPTNADLAQEFIDYVLGAEGQAILAAAGFGPR